jgi:hypothetical protein
LFRTQEGSFISFSIDEIQLNDRLMNSLSD